jgi:hypothetical protein
MALSVARQCSAIGRSASVKHLFKPSNAGRVPRLRLSAPTRNVEVKATGAGNTGSLIATRQLQLAAVATATEASSLPWSNFADPVKSSSN